MAVRMGRGSRGASLSLEKHSNSRDEFSIPAYGSYEGIAQTIRKLRRFTIPFPIPLHVDWSIQGRAAASMFCCEKPVAGRGGARRLLEARDE